MCVANFDARARSCAGLFSKGKEEAAGRSFVTPDRSSYVHDCFLLRAKLPSPFFETVCLAEVLKSNRPSLVGGVPITYQPNHIVYDIEYNLPYMHRL